MRYEGNCFTVLVDPEAPETIWAATGEWARNHGCVCRSDDDGATWQVVGEPETGLPDGQVRALLLDPSSPVASRRLLATVRGHGLYASRDGGASWSPVNGDLPPETAREPRGLILGAQDPKHLVAAFAGPDPERAGVYGTRDAGRTWRRLHGGTPFADVQALRAGPDGLGTLYVAARERYDHAAHRLYPGGLLRSVDGGRTWRRLLDYHFVSDVAVSAARPGLIYAATHDHPFHDECVAEGVLRSTDGGRTWRRENAGLSLLNVSSLRIDPHDPAVIYAGTHGNSAFVGRDRGVAGDAAGG
jgi:photosystem II stability/assembly factor-like uncharacterized protein